MTGFRPVWAPASAWHGRAKLTAQVFADALPAFEGAVEAFREGVIPGAVERNREFLGDALQVAPEVDEALVHLGCDAQTSGGLLIAIPPDRLEKLQQALARAGVKAFVIGEFAQANGRRHACDKSPLQRRTDTQPRKQPTATRACIMNQ